MGNKLYVRNLPYAYREGDLERVFGRFGAVTSAKVVMETDGATDRSKGFGFVEMGSDAEAQAAITGLHGHMLGDRAVKVVEANKQPPQRTAAAYRTTERVRALKRPSAVVVTLETQKG